MKKEITVYELAREAEVSTATVSRVINNSPNVDFQTRKRILLLFRKYNYNPKLVKAKTIHIVFIVNKVDDPNAALSDYVSGVFEGALKFANEEPISLSTLLFNFNSLRHPTELASILLQRGFDGAVFINPKVNADYIDTLHEINYPFVTIGSFFSNPGISSLNIDNREGIRKAITHLRSKGLSNIGFVGVDNQHYDSVERLDAFRSYMVDKIDERQLLLTFQKEGDHKKAAYNYINEFCGRKDMAPADAYICLNDDVALGVLRAFIKNGYRIPEDISIIGFDNYSYTEYLNPSMTTLNNPLLDMGYLACSSVANACKGSPVTVRRLFIPELIERESCCKK